MRPTKSLFLSFPYSRSRLDVSLWPPSERDGKALAPSISLRVQKSSKDSHDAESSVSAYFKASDALKLAAVLQQYAFEALEEDSEARLENWKKKNSVQAAQALPASD